jgi:para-aminobenzoate synthetase / 4-amino-4-deoxychorismate lyase
MHLDESGLRSILAGSGTVLLDDASPTGSHAMLFRRPVRTIAVSHPNDVRAALLDVDRALAAGQWVAGYLTYEAGEAFIGVESRRAAGPLLWFGVFEEPEAVTLLVTEAVGERLEFESIEPTRGAYLEQFRRVKHHIHEGDVYQINLTGRVHLRCADPVDTYLRLRSAQPVPYGAFINDGIPSGHSVMSFSPERFFRLDGRRLVARPMKGTAPRSRDEIADRDIARGLALDPKNRAENLMIVDLLRNDLSRVCEPGTVTVPSLFSVEAHPTLWQMTSDVEGTLRTDVALSDVLGALFPCGSITGAPKHRAMSIIRDIEPWPRGVYCGAIGYASPDGRAEFNVAIRTVEVQGGAAVMGAGSGVVWDSDADAEYDELLLKTRFLSAAAGPEIELMETMLFDGRAVVRLERHLDRMARSASELGFAWSSEDARKAIDDAAAACTESGVIRLSLRRDGVVRIRRRPISQWPRSPVRVAILESYVDSSDRTLRFKTSDRDLYDRAAEAASSVGADEAIMVNERGEVTEGAISNVFIERQGVLLTPPLSSGLLPGVLREELIETGLAVEAVLRREDLEEAEAIYLGNSVRGLCRAHLVDVPART